MMEDMVVSAKSFTLCVTSLPEAARERLDAESPLDWTALEDPATGNELVQAVRDRRRLPEPVEALVARLIGEVGVVPDDLAAGVERTGAASAWLGHLSIEPDGESYRLRNRLDGAVLAGIRPETVAGYAALALALATVVRETAGLWIEAGERHAADDSPVTLARCAVAMNGRLKALAEDGPSAVSTATLSGALEDAWNAQGLEMRAELATADRPVPEPGACAPRPRFLAPAMSYRLHACDPGEMRWLRALAEWAGAPAEEAGSEETASRIPLVDEPSAACEIGPEATPGPAGSGTVEPFRNEPGSDPDDLGLGEELAELQRTADRLASAPGAVSVARAAADSGAGKESASLDMTALEMEIRANGAPALEFCADPEGSRLDEELARLKEAVTRLPDAVRRRLGETHGVGLAQAAARLRDAADGDTILPVPGAGIAQDRPPGWLEELAATVLADAGAETGEGVRTGSLRLDPAEDPEDGYLALEMASGMQGRLTLPGLIRQAHRGLAFARQASTALVVLRTAGAESGWTLDEGPNGTGLLASERETLEAARQIQRALDRLREARGEPHRPRTALEQAAMAAEAMRTVGPTVRAAAGWPGALGPPDPRNPDDVARMAAFAETLHEAVRSICDRQIAGGMAAAHGA